MDIIFYHPTFDTPGGSLPWKKLSLVPESGSGSRAITIRQIMRWSGTHR